MVLEAVSVLVCYKMSSKAFPKREMRERKLGKKERKKLDDNKDDIGEKSEILFVKESFIL